MTSEVKNRKRKPVREENGFKRSEFINYDLTKDDKEGFRAFVREHSADIGDFIDELLESGYSLSIKRDSYHNCYGAYIQPVSQENPNAGYILSGRGSSGTMALLGALFRHLALFERDWPTDTVRRDTLDDGE